MNSYIIIIIILYLIDYFIKPSIDYTKGKDILLWYCKKNRKYIKLFTL